VADFCWLIGKQERHAACEITTASATSRGAGAVKFRHFFNFSYVYFWAKCLATQRWLSELLCLWFPKVSVGHRPKFLTLSNSRKLGKLYKNWNVCECVMYMDVIPYTYNPVSDKARYLSKIKRDTTSRVSRRLCSQLPCSIEHASYSGLFSNRVVNFQYVF